MPFDWGRASFHITNFFNPKVYSVFEKVLQVERVPLCGVRDPKEEEQMWWCEATVIFRIFCTRGNKGLEREQVLLVCLNKYE